MNEQEPQPEASGAAAPPPSRSRAPRIAAQGRAWWKIGAVVVLLALAMWAGHAWGGRIGAAARGAWRVLAGQHASATSAKEAGGQVQYYTCGMHPWVVLPKPGDCPICGMKLVPLDPAKFTGEVTINPVVVQNIGVRVAPVTTGPVERTIRTVGTVDYDETRLYDVNIKTPGWIEKLYVDYLGVSVKEGDPLFSLYSPDLYAAQEEYLQAWRNRDKVGASFLPDAAKAAADLLDSARTRLEFFDVTRKQIEELQERGTPLKSLTLASPHSGVVIAKHAVEGMKVDAGMQVFRIADLSKVWVIVTLYEYQLPYVSLGQKATMTLPYIPGQSFDGEVLYIYPYLDSKTRQVNVRLAFDNARGLLKPGMYTTVELHSVLAQDRVLAPRSAVLDTGERKVAFVSLGGGRFEPRGVRTGVLADDDKIEVLSGLKPGELVVTSGQFLIDSEAKVREALARMVKGDLAADQRTRAVVAGVSELRSLPAPAAEAIAQILRSSFAISEKLAEDSTRDLSPDARALAGAVDTLVEQKFTEAPSFWREHPEAATVRGKALELADTTELDQARLRFADLSVALDQLVLATGVPPGFGTEVEELHCPMFRQGQGGTVWLQASGAVRNPYMGSKMIGCFDARRTLPVTGAPAAVPPPAGETTPPPPPAEGGAGPAWSPAARGSLERLLAAYAQIQGALADDKGDAAAEPARRLKLEAGTLARSADPEVASLARAIDRATPAEAMDIDAFRIAFKEISLAVIDLVKRSPGDALGAGLYQMHCPMTKADWLQTTANVANPYYGQSMATCGSVVATFGAARKAELP